MASISGSGEIVQHYNKLLKTLRDQAIRSTATQSVKDHRISVGTASGSFEDGQLDVFTEEPA